MNARDLTCRITIAVRLFDSSFVSPWVEAVPSEQAPCSYAPAQTVAAGICVVVCRQKLTSKSRGRLEDIEDFD